MPCYHIPAFPASSDIDWQRVPHAPIDHFLWEKNGFCPVTFAQLAWTEEALYVRLWSHEQDPRRIFTDHQSSVCEDSCLEFFVNFLPLNTSDFFNFEVNPNGAMLAAFGPPRYDRTPLALEQWAPQMDIRPQVIPGVGWGVTYRIPWALVQAIQPGFIPEAGRMIVGNFYKCGDCTPLPHYGAWNPVEMKKPDFHRPEFFATMMLEG